MTLEAHLPLSEDSGLIAQDYSKNGYDGDIQNNAGPQGTGTTTGPFGNSAYKFSSSSKDHIDITTNFQLSGENDPLSISLWMNVQDNGNRFNPIAYRNPNNNGGMGFKIQVSTDLNEVRFTIVSSGSSKNEIASPDFSYDTWHHVVGVSDGSTLHLYIDGEEKATGGITINAGAETQSPIHISQHSAGADKSYIDGSLADVRIYSHALSPQEVQALYQAGERSEAVFGVTDSTATAQSVSGGGGGGSSGGGGGGTNY